MLFRSTADFEKRVTIIAKKHDITYTEAKKLVGKKDTARAAYYKYYSNGKWSHEKGKDIILNRATLGIEGCVEIIKDYVVWKEDCLEKVIL